MKISKELVSEVFKLNICEAYIENNILYFDMGLPLIQSINIYEFVHMCKEWAFDKGYPFNVLYRYDYWDRCELKYDVDLYNHRKSFCSDIEVEAIIKACNWILEELNERFEDKQRAN